MPGVCEHGVLGGADFGEGDVEAGVEAFLAGEVAVEGDDDVAEGGAEMIGDGGEADLCAAYREGWEDMGDERGCGWWFQLDLPSAFRRHERR
jgi:hypothetical protein